MVAALVTNTPWHCIGPPKLSSSEPCDAIQTSLSIVNVIFVHSQ